MVRHQIYIIYSKNPKKNPKPNLNITLIQKHRPKKPKCKHYNYRSPTLNLF